MRVGLQRVEWMRTADAGGQVSLEDDAIKVPVNTIAEEDKIVLERREVNERIHWFVNGADKGHIFVRKDSYIAKITEILYDQIGHGWVPHKTFMNACAWKEDEYFAASGEPGRMQRQLTVGYQTALGGPFPWRERAAEAEKQYARCLPQWHWQLSQAHQREQIIIPER